MKYIKTMNEMVKNPKLVKLTIKQMFKELDFLNLNDNILSLNKEYDPYLNFKIRSRPEKYLKSTLDVLNKYKKIFLKLDYILSFEYEIFNDVILDKNDNVIGKTNDKVFDLQFFIKNTKTIRIKPKRFVYHYSPKENREDIEKFGLIPQSFENSKEWNKFGHLELEYEDAIFAVTIDNLAWDAEYDKWEIDTLHLKNKWWKDLNFSIKENAFIMTFEPIPPEFLELDKTKA